MADEGYLERMRGDGSLESSGTFTLDALQLAHQLGHFQLPDPHLYLVKLVQAAIAGGAMRISFSSKPRGCLEMDHDARQLESVALGDLLSHLLDGERYSPQLRHLAVGVNTALHLGRGVELDGQFRLRLSGLPCAGPHPPEIAGLLSRCRACIPVLWNGHAVNRLLKSGYVVQLRQDEGVDFDATLVESDGICHFLDADPNQPGIPGVQSLLGRGLRWVSGHLSQPDSWKLDSGRRQWFHVHSQQNWEPWHLRRMSQGGRSLLKCSAVIQKIPRQRSLLLPVMHGVEMDPQALDDFPVGYRIWVSAHRLHTDLSGFQVVREQAYRTLLQSLQRLIDFAW